jgi:hypothetical protein
MRSSQGYLELTEPEWHSDARTVRGSGLKSKLIEWSFRSTFRETTRGLTIKRRSTQFSADCRPPTCPKRGNTDDVLVFDLEAPAIQLPPSPKMTEDGGIKIRRPERRILVGVARFELTAT